MAIQPGTRLGPYEIVASIGAGGMGEVWRAKDTRLDRDVAIKVLPPGFAENEQFLQRFDREAKAISKLSHPHVCTLYDVGEAATSDERRAASEDADSSLAAHRSPLHYLVMEYLEGESLADRIRRGPLPLADVLKFGRQIASALDAAHRRGITHRDLKPGNVMLTKSGAKLVDFGLARTAAEGKAPIEGLTNVPTQAKPLTKEGTILGTFQYMAPEQLEGLEADARTDIFAFGAVLYEMATGQRAFQGQSKTSLIAAIVSAQPEPISSVVAMSPPALDHVVRKCLEKDPDDRWQSASDVASQLQWISEAGSAAGVATPRARRRRRLAWIGWVAAALIATAWIATVLLRKPAPQPRIETAIVPPDGVFLDASKGGIALSSNGRRIAFVGHKAGEKRRVWIRDLASSASQAVAGTDGASIPFWSPDDKSIAFVSSRGLEQVPIEGGTAQLLAPGVSISGGTWSPDGEIVYADGAAIYRVAASGGTPTKVLELKDRFATNPRMLPDGKRFLFTSIRGTSEPDAVYLSSLDGAQPKRVLEGVYSNVAYAPGVILYVKEGDLRAQPVDPKTLEPHSSPVRVAQGVQYDPDSKNGLFALSRNGLLAYVRGEVAGETELVWVSRDGKDLGTLGKPAMYYSPRLSHDGARTAVDMSESQTAKGDIWIFDLERGSSTRLTWDPANESSPTWTPDDRNVIFFSEKGGGMNLYERSAGGVGGDEPVLVDKTRKIPLEVSPDGRWLAFEVVGVGLKADIWLLDLQSHKAKPFLVSPFLEGSLQFSPDGKWVAYSSNESGQHEVYVRQFPESSGKWVVSRGGGEQPAWSADGRTIYYYSKDHKIMSVAVKLGPDFDSGPPVALFDANLRGGFGFRQYCVSRDGSRFLLNRVVGENATHPITLVQNWTNVLTN